MSCLKQLKEQGLKLTPQRRLIVDIIHASAEHVTAEEIIKKVKIRMPGVNKSTVYRTLEMLEKAGCILKSGTEDGFIFHPAEEGRHHHLLCSACQKTVVCDEDFFATMEKSLDEKYGFKVSFKHLVITGLCQECRQNNPL
jgi:Fur family transcriptional regulator, ferric uptake regulator